MFANTLFRTPGEVLLKVEGLVQSLANGLWQIRLRHGAVKGNCSPETVHHDMTVSTLGQMPVDFRTKSRCQFAIHVRRQVIQHLAT